MLYRAATHGLYDVLLWELQLGNISLSEYTLFQAANPKLKIRNLLYDGAEAERKEKHRYFMFRRSE